MNGRDSVLDSQRSSRGQGDLSEPVHPSKSSSSNHGNSSDPRAAGSDVSHATTSSTHTPAATPSISHDASQSASNTHNASVRGSNKVSVQNDRMKEDGSTNDVPSVQDDESSIDGTSTLLKASEGIARIT